MPAGGPPPARSVLARLAAPVGALAAVGAAFAVVGTLDPNEPGHYPTCPFLYLTGLDCPGCGGLRTAHAVAHGDLGTALSVNVLAVAAFVAFAVYWIVWVLRALRHRPMNGLTLRPSYWWPIGVLVLGFTVVRNLPFGAALAS
ncbi:DUF2752 domain-containing protein [Streptomyces sp. N2-109]|uniref:DUF2752 domain-containing protein n=2 Tax=Streptomyces gossypii TaxID=2883101 RepID=A0ABT2K2I7_9ACTN|nr:DUF2752 domain-containing protein [Streptomyces gossypii]MCT2594365.1 DUF2752 domain-containing protein [Streptomyces gossypii]